MRNNHGALVLVAVFAWLIVAGVAGWIARGIVVRHNAVQDQSEEK
jgi:cytochrome b